MNLTISKLNFKPMFMANQKIGKAQVSKNTSLPNDTFTPSFVINKKQIFVEHAEKQAEQLSKRANEIMSEALQVIKGRNCSEKPVFQILNSDGKVIKDIAVIQYNGETKKATLEINNLETKERVFVINGKVDSYMKGYKKTPNCVEADVLFAPGNNSKSYYYAEKYRALNCGIIEVSQAVKVRNGKITEYTKI